MQSFPLDDRSAAKVNLASGDLFIRSTDLSTKGTGVPLVLQHNYDSLNTEGGSVNPWYSLPGSSVFADGSLSVGLLGYDKPAFIRKADGSFLTPSGINATMCAVNETTCTGNKVDKGGADYALTFNQNGNGPMYAAGNKITFSSTGGLLSLADRYGNALSFSFGEFGISGVTDTQSRSFTRHFVELPSKYHATSAWLDSAGGREVGYAYNAESQLATYTDALGHKTKYVYNGSGEISEITDPNANVTKLSYDTSRRVTKITQPEVGGKHPIWEYAYYVGSDTEHGHACSAVGVTKKTVVTDPNLHQSTFCSNVMDEVLQSFDAAGNMTEATFNSLGNPTSSSAASPGSGESGNVESLNYNESSTGSKLMCAVTDPSTRESSCPSGSSKTVLVTSFNYKDESNPYQATQVKDPQGNTTFACYNHALEKGHEGSECPAAKGPSGSLQNITDPLSAENVLSFEHSTTNGTITSSTDARGKITSYEYDTKGNLKKITPPTGSGLKETTIEVDANSRPHVITDGAGHIQTISYDKDDRITEIAYTGTGTARTVKYTYDSNGNITKREDPTGTTKYTLDALNRLTKEELPGPLANEYGYDAASNRSSFSDGGGTTKYTFNNLNELESTTEPSATKSTKFSYDGNHRLTKITYPSGASENYKLEPTSGRPETITFEGITGTTVPNLTYKYLETEKNTTQIRELTESGGAATTYKYDPLNRLTSAVTTGTGKASRYLFTLDGNGNRTEQTVNPSESTGGTTTYYDTNPGNLLECRQTISGACSKSSSTELSAYTFDNAGNALEITPKLDPAAPPSPITRHASSRASRPPAAKPKHCPTAAQAKTTSSASAQRPCRPASSGSHAKSTPPAPATTPAHPTDYSLTSAPHPATTTRSTTHREISSRS